MTSAVLSYGKGTLVLIISETVDATPKSKVQSSNFFISDSPNNYTIPLNGADVIEVDATNLTLILTESSRVAAVRTSTFSPNGDGDIPVLDIKVGAFIDVGQNEVLGATGIPLIEIPDTIAPTLLSATLNFSLGELDLIFEETLDLTPIARFNATKISFANSSTGGIDSFALDGLEGGGATLVSNIADTTTLKLLLSEEQRTTLLEVSEYQVAMGMRPLLTWRNLLCRFIY